MKSLLLAGAAVLASSLSVHAQVAYTDSALNGCYAHLSSSVDTGAAAVNRDIVGTMCFDGKGNIVAATHAPYLSGAVKNTNGVVKSHDDVTGTYQVTNAPGDGMGVFQGKCTKHAFVLRNVDSNGLAHGFSFILMNRKKSCQDNGPMVIGGGAEYQGPLH
jgi:hypothetical protein